MPNLSMADLLPAIENIIARKLPADDELAELHALARRNGIRYKTMYRAKTVVEDLHNQRSNP